MALRGAGEVYATLEWGASSSTTDGGLLSPSLVRLALLVGAVVGLALKPLCAFFAVPLPQTRQVFAGLCVLEGSEVLLVTQVGVDLVKIAGVPACLLLRLLAAYGRHVGLWSPSDDRPRIRDAIRYVGESNCRLSRGKCGGHVSAGQQKIFGTG